MRYCFTLEQLAIGVTHAVYRNTEVEDFHSLNRIMDHFFYDDVYAVVNKNMNKLLQVKKILNILYKDGIGHASRFNGATKEELNFLGDIIIGVQCGSNWDRPQEITILPEGDLSSYLLDGEFKKRCTGVQRFDDSVMKAINKDITNRIYMILKYLILESDA